MHPLLNQIRAQIGNVKEYVKKGHHHRVIVAEIEKIEQRFAEYESALAAAPASPPTPAVDDTARLDWLELQHVEVRTPARYGSYANFHASPSDIDFAEPHSDLRERIDAALKPEPPK